MIRFKYKSFILVICLISVFLYIKYLWISNHTFINKITQQVVYSTGLPTGSYLVTLDRILNKNEYVTLAVVVCELRLLEALVMMKSAIIFRSSSNLKFLVLSDYNLQKEFDNKLHGWQRIVNNSFTYELHNLSFPNENGNEWRNLFKPCAAQRLFLPNVLINVDAVIYVDTDTVFLSPIRDIWSHFYNMNSSQIAALTPEHEDASIGWYNRFARHPFYGPLGVNSGVMLMNLTRMRNFNWSTYLNPVLKEYKLKLTWGDQDIINIIFHYNPEKLYIYSCRYNYRPDHCMYMSVCKEAEVDGVAVLHGSRGAFHSDKHSTFRVIYDVINNYTLESDLFEYLYKPMESHLNKTRDTKCGSIGHIFLYNIRKHLLNNTL